jgi:hypothetical protein
MFLWLPNIFPEWSSCSRLRELAGYITYVLYTVKIADYYKNSSETYGTRHMSLLFFTCIFHVECVWNLMAQGDAREGKWRVNCRMEWVASTLHTTSERGVSSITNAYAHTSAASSRLNWRPRRFKWTRPFRLKTKSGFCACAITFQTQSTSNTHTFLWVVWHKRYRQRDIYKFISFF